MIELKAEISEVLVMSMFRLHGQEWTKHLRAMVLEEITAQFDHAVEHALRKHVEKKGPP